MAKYAENTSVSCAKSRMEIEETLARYGADSFAYASTGGKAMIAFRMHERQAKLMVPLPKIEEYQYTDKGRKRTEDSQYSAWEQGCRQIWRVMLLMIKAKLEAIELEATTFDREFLASTLLPDGRTVEEHVLPQIERAYETGEVPPVMLMLGE